MRGRQQMKIKRRYRRHRNAPDIGAKMADALWDLETARLGRGQRPYANPRNFADVAAVNDRARLERDVGGAIDYIDTHVGLAMQEASVNDRMRLASDVGAVTHYVDQYVTRGGLTNAREIAKPTLTASYDLGDLDKFVKAIDTDARPTFHFEKRDDGGYHVRVKGATSIGDVYMGVVSRTPQSDRIVLKPLGSGWYGWIGEVPGTIAESVCKSKTRGNAALYLWRHKQGLGPDA